MATREQEALTRMFETVLLPIDEHGGTDVAIQRAFDIAQRFGSSLHILHVTPTGREIDGLNLDERKKLQRSLEKRGEGLIIDVAKRAENIGLEPRSTVSSGVPHSVITAYASDHGVELIVMGTMARSKPHVGLGSTAERVILRSPSPVLAIPVGGEERSDFAMVARRILIATDGSDGSSRAAELGLELAASYDAEGFVIYVIDSTIYEFADAPRSILGLLKEGGGRALDGIIDAGDTRDLTIRSELRRGVPDQEIVTLAGELEADLVVMGVSGRGGAADRFLGSTTARVLRQSSCPILTVR